MDVNRRGIVVFGIRFVFVVVELCMLASANVVFQVKHKYSDNKRSLNALKHHDANRHRRFLSAAELPLGGDGSPTSAALVFHCIISIVYFQLEFELVNVVYGFYCLLQLITYMLRFIYFLRGDLLHCIFLFFDLYPIKHYKQIQVMHMHALSPTQICPWYQCLLLCWLL